MNLSVTGAFDTGPPERNLVFRAAMKFYSGLGAEPAIEIRLHKRIPVAAGLGGGSSDAAATLRALNAFHQHPFDRDTLLRWGADLGSDVPFFLTGSPFALAWNRGDRLIELEAPPVRNVVIADPGVPMPTADAFRALADNRREKPAGSVPWCVAARSLSRWDCIESIAHNDFEAIPHEPFTALLRAKTCLHEAGATIALLAGSGACVFGIFSDPEHLSVADAALQELGFSTHHATTLTRWPEPRTRD